jgi:ABC-type multidrug transport system permease subunit
MIKLLSIIKKNFLLLVHSKISSLILIFGPIFLILLVGAGLGNAGLRDIQASIYIFEESEFTSLFLQDLNEKSFNFQKSQTLEQCKSDVKNGESSLCIEMIYSDVDIPSELEIDPLIAKELGIGYSMIMHVDFSKQRIVWGIMSNVDSSVNSFSAELRDELSESLKEKINNYSYDIDDKIDKIDLAISYLDNSNIYFQEIDYQIQTYENDMNILDERINDLGDEINRLPNSVLLSDGTYMYFNNIQSSYSGLRSSYFGFKNRNLNIDLRADIENIKSDIKNAKAELIDTKEKLEEVSDSMKKIGEINMDYILHPIPLSYQSLSDDFVGETKDSLEFLDYIFPTFLTFFILMTSILFGNILIMKERVSSSYIRNVMSKASRVTFLFANYLTVFFIIYLQCLVMIFFGGFFLNVNVFLHFASWAILLFLSISLFVVFGMLFGYLFNSQETSTIASLSLILAMIIFSPLISPLETLPAFFRAILAYSPMVITEDILRRIFIFDSGIYYYPIKILALSVTLIVSIGILIFVSSLAKNKELK